MTQDSGMQALSNEEVIQLLESWLRTSPDMQFRQVRKDAGRLNLRVTARQFSEARRRLGVTAGPPRPTTRPAAPPAAAPPVSNDRSAAVQGKTPLMSFVLEYMRGKPEAEYADVKSAANTAGFSIAPINYGNARRMLGLGSKAPRPSADGARTPPVAAPLPRGRRSRRPGIDLSNLSSLVAELQEVVAERDRYVQALEQIAQVLKNVL